MRSLLNTETIIVDVKNQPDQELLAIAQSNPAAFEEIVCRYERPFLAKARSIIGESEEAQDIVQEAFTKIYINAHKFTPQKGAQFSSWAYKILLNVAFTHYKKRKKEQGRFVAVDQEILEGVVADETSEAREYERADIAAQVVHTLSGLPRHLRNVLHLYFIKGKSHKEIAEIEDVSVGAIKTRMHRAKKEFKKHVLREKPSVI